MNRRNFLAKLGLGILAVPFLSKLVPREEKLLPLPRVHFKSVNKEFSVGFKVSREMIEDDSMYHTNGLSRQWLRAWADANRY